MRNLSKTVIAALIFVVVLGAAPAQAALPQKHTTYRGAPQGMPLATIVAKTGDSRRKLTKLTAKFTTCGQNFKQVSFGRTNVSANGSFQASKGDNYTIKGKFQPGQQATGDIFNRTGCGPRKINFVIVKA